MCGASIMILYKNEIVSKEKTTMPKRGANEQNHHAVVIVKRTAGVLRIKLTGYGQIDSIIFLEQSTW